MKNKIVRTQRLVSGVGLAVSLLLLLLGAVGSRAATTPKVGDSAPAFALKTLDDKSVELKQLQTNKAVVLVVLRGWPGYQCPACTLQVREFIEQAGKFATEGAHVVMVYPGPAEKLKEHAQEFLQQKDWPKHFSFVLDPDYELTKSYGLRWEAKNETAYPSTFVINKAGQVTFGHVSKSHGDRVSPKSALEAVQKQK